mgnify:CR=1 FL=1
MDTNISIAGIQTVLALKCVQEKIKMVSFIKEETVTNAIKLTKFLMEKYDISVENIIRHYDVTGKICPRSFVEDEKLWLAFKDRLEDEEVKRYNTSDEVP